MNYSINYSGFVDLAISSDSNNAYSSDYEATENCKPALAAQLYKGEELEQLVRGVTIHNPIRPR